MGKYRPISKVEHVETWWEDTIKISDLEAFAKKHGFTNDQVVYETTLEWPDNCIERIICGTREATEEDKKKHKEQWKKDQELLKQHKAKQALESKKLIDETEYKEYLRLKKKFEK